MTIKRIITSVFLVAQVLVGLSQENVNDGQTIEMGPDWTTYETDSFSLIYPKLWEINELHSSEAVFVIMGPVDSTTIFQSNINLMIYSVEEVQVSFEQFMNENMDYTAQNYPDRKLVTNEFYRHFHHPAHHMKYEMKLMGIDIIAEQHNFWQDGKNYMLTAMYPVSQEDEVSYILGAMSLSLTGK